jgi:hypothetical protein
MNDDVFSDTLMYTWYGASVAARYNDPLNNCTDSSASCSNKHSTNDLRTRWYDYELTIERIGWESNSFFLLVFTALFDVVCFWLWFCHSCEKRLLSEMNSRCTFEGLSHRFHSNFYSVLIVHLTVHLTQHRFSK